MKDSSDASLLRKTVRLMIEANEKLRTYNVCRKHTGQELEIAVGRYFSDGTIRGMAPDLFEGPEAARRAIKDAGTVRLTDADIGKLQNSEASSVLDGVGVSDDAEKDADSAAESVGEAKAMPPPVVIRDAAGALVLLDGEAQLLCCIALGLSPLFKVIDYDGRFML